MSHADDAAATDAAVHRFENLYCAGCLCTQRFLDLDVHLVCERCSREVVRSAPRVGRLPTLSATESPIAWGS